MLNRFATRLAFLLAIAGLKPKFAFADNKSTSGGNSDGSTGTGSDGDGSDTGGAGDNDKVSYETYKKTVGEIKALKRQLKEATDKLGSAENDRLSAEGKKDELIAKLRGDNEKLTKGQKELLNNFVGSSLENQVREVAAGMGCVDVEAVGKLIDLSDIEVDTKTFKADKDAITEALGGLKKSKPYLFNKVAPKVNGKMPSGAGQGQDGKKSIKEMSTKELWAELKALKQ